MTDTWQRKEEILAKVRELAQAYVEVQKEEDEAYRNPETVQGLREGYDLGVFGELGVHSDGIQPFSSEWDCPDPKVWYDQMRWGLPYQEYKEKYQNQELKEEDLDTDVKIFPCLMFFFPLQEAENDHAKRWKEKMAEIIEPREYDHEGWLREQQDTVTVQRSDLEEAVDLIHKLYRPILDARGINSDEDHIHRQLLSKIANMKYSVEK